MKWPKCCDACLFTAPTGHWTGRSTPQRSFRIPAVRASCSILDGRMTAERDKAAVKFKAMNVCFRMDKSSASCELSEMKTLFQKIGTQRQNRITIPAR